ncbi:MAG: citrate lyase holo-[acyl-carrier protein] synthase [Candidatus Izimaplasma sp.]|nr:citrate lyase holo-[acyl-carrier protein] synthase [Candidatus Izimaplasma bacterium]
MSLLEAREQRSNHIQKLLKKNKHKTLISLKKNVVGKNKNLDFMMFICAYFNRKIIRNLEISFSKEISSEDGDYFIYVSNQSPNLVKQQAIELEEQLPIGRLVDIDVYHDNQVFSRQSLNYPLRKCLICDEFAHICVRSKAHKKEEILIKTKHLIHDFLRSYITDIAIDAIKKELALFPCFGLVSYEDSGMHKDMNYTHFEASIEALRPYIINLINLGFSKSIDVDELVTLGQDAERDMYKATNGINTHKGLIFLLGLVIPAMVEGIFQHKPLSYLQPRIKELSKNIVGDYYSNLTSKKKLSNGDQIYLNYQIKGIRKLALDGLAPLFKDAMTTKNITDVYLKKRLIYYMSLLNDTTIIHKTNLLTLKKVQEEANQLYEDFSLSKYNDFSNKYNNISPGGSADLLVIDIIFNRVKYLLHK